MLVLEEPVLRPRQAQILPQRLAFVFPPEDFALLQLRHDLVDEVVEPGGQRVSTLTAVSTVLMLPGR